MGISVVMRGEGDMKKSTYDSDLNGIIDYDVLEEFPLLPDYYLALKGVTAGDFGTTPVNVCDGDLTTEGRANAINQFIVVDFGAVKRRVTEFRQYGSATNNGTGRWKIQHWNGAAWVDNTVGIVIEATGAYTAWTALTTPIDTTAIKLICTTVDTAFALSAIGEFEMRG